MFKPLTLAEIERIVDLQLDELRERLADRRITLEVTTEARRFIADQGFDPAYGARPLRRYISREVETQVGRALLRGDAADGRHDLGRRRRRRDHGDRGQQPGRRAGSGMTATDAEVTKVVCGNCGAKNRVPAVAKGVPRCGKCSTAAALGGGRERRRRSTPSWTSRACPCWSTCGLRGAGPAGW